MSAEIVIKTILTNIPAICLMFTFLFFLLNPTSENLKNQILRWTVGVLFLWGGFFHVFFPETAAKSIGWKVSPFQKEVGYYDLIVGLTAFLSSFSKFSKLKDGVIIIFSGFSFAAGVNHLYESSVLKNKSKNNSGLILWLDLLMPVILMYLQYFS